MKSTGTYVAHRACSDSSSWRQCEGKRAIFLRDFLVSSMKFNVFDDATDATGEDRTKPKPLSELSSTAEFFLGQTEMNKWRSLTIRLAAKSL